MTEIPLPQEWARWRPAPLLPIGDGRDRALVFVVATLCFLACLTVFAALAGDRAAQGWRADLAASATVQVRPTGGQSPPEASARAAEALAGVAGVVEARVLDRAESQRLLEPWLGKGNIPDDLPIPRLVAIDLDPAAPATPEALRFALSQAGVDAELDDHSRWMKEVERAGAAVRAAALAAGLLTAAAAGAVIAFATRAGLAARRDVVEVLHLTGAHDRFVAGLFQRRFAGLAARAGTYGAIAAAALAALARFFGGAEGFTPALPLNWLDLAAVLPCPLLAAAVAAISARRTALSILRAEP
ncbi:MAG: cell division protein [Caulobacterales bacterium 32-69-10]|nr:MAG: cell division protein [Caulobacterales bacterium 32-69-10]